MDETTIVRVCRERTRAALKANDKRFFPSLVPLSSLLPLTRAYAMS